MIRLACSKCQKTITRPVWVGGVAFGSTCAQSIAGVRASRGTTKRARRVKQAEQETDPRQLSLLESACES